MAARGIFRRPGLRSVALCAMVVAAALTQASPSFGYGAGNPSVIVDLSAIDEAVSARHTWPQANQAFRSPEPERPGTGTRLRPPPLMPPPHAPVSPGASAASAPRPGTPGFYTLFPPPPPVTAEVPSSEAAPSGTGHGTLSAADLSAVAALPVARPVPVVPARTRFAAPTPRKPIIGAASAMPRLPAIRPSRSASPRSVAYPLRVPSAKPARRQEADEVARRVRLRLPYPVAGTDLSPSAQGQLEALALEVGSNDRIRLRLAAYANAGAGSPAKARRTSLTRALAVRGFLIERGIKASRIDLRALGNTAGAAEADRVDVVVSDK